MDYLKEFQAFAGRFSAAAEDKLASVDGGTYNEFFRFYSQTWPAETSNAVDDEQRQINILLEKLHMAMESPSLLPALPGTVLHTGAVETGVGPALSRLCVALEKCLFFGAEGSMPDFWWVLRRAGGEDRSAIASTGGFSGDLRNGQRECDEGSAATGGTPTETAAVSGGTPEPLAVAVCRLTRVHTGHARCRAWVRSVLGVDGTFAEGELRRAAEVVVPRSDGGQAEANVGNQGQDASVGAMSTEGFLRGETMSGGGAEVARVLTATEDRDDTGTSDPDAGGGGGHDGGGSRTVTAAGSTLPANEVDRSVWSTSDALPLWLRPGPQGASVLDDVCKSVVDFSSRLKERGLSIRPSLDHAWLDHENIAATTTYTWPRFPRERLRCYVRGAGLSASNGEYSPARTDQGEAGGSLTLVGPNGCRICRHVCTVDDGQAAVVSAVENIVPVEPTAALEVADEEKGVAMEANTVLPVTHQTEAGVAAAAAAAAVVAKVWCLLIPVATGLDKSAYYCLGDGALPPCRGWRATEATEAPGPVLGFATLNDGEFDAGAGGEGEDPLQVAGEEETAKTSFEAAVAVACGDDVGAVGIVARKGALGETKAGMVTAGASVETKACREGLVSPPLGGRLTRRRKRRRPPESATVRSIEWKAIGADSQGNQPKNLVESSCLERSKVIDSFEGGGASSGLWSDSSDVDRDTACESLGAVACTQAGGAGVDGCVDGDEAVATFKTERWRLPAPSGELLLRVERTRELLRQATEEGARMLAVRRSQLLDEVDAAEGDYQEVLEESMSATVERVLQARPDLREEAEAEVAREAQLLAQASGGGQVRSENEVPSLEELVAEKAEELRTRPQSPTREEARPPTPPALEDHDSLAAGLVGLPPAADVGWPWPVDWLSAPRAPPRDVEFEEGEGMIDFGGFSTVDEDAGPGDEDWVDTPPFSIEVEAVEAADVEDPEASHVEYVLRVVYREVRRVHSTPTATAAEAVEAGSAGGGHRTHMSADIAAAATGDSRAAKLTALATAAKGLVQRSRVLSKRLNSLCALHPRLMWELEEGRHLRAGGNETADRLVFPDPFELGTLEESILRVHRDKLTPRFKAHIPMRKLSAQIGSYLSSLLHFLGVLEAAGDTDVRARMSRALNDALSTCDRVGRKRRQGDFLLGVRLEDIPGGRLGSGVGDEERLRVQGRSCMGCGRGIAAEFLGIKKDYFPCRFANGLFCRRYCHNEDRRVVPHRVVHHWDFTPHRVCKDSARFLDATRFLPVVKLPEQSPRVFAEQQSLRLVHSRRTQLHFLRRAVLLPAECRCVSGARVLEDFLDGRTHLAVDPGLYSLEDLVGVKKGTLLDFVEEACEALLAHIMEDCETCQARAARVCSLCFKDEAIFAFQLGAVARCPSCGSLFHAKCVTGQGRDKTAAGGGSKRWIDQTGAGGIFVCPQCNAVASMSEAIGE